MKRKRFILNDTSSHIVFNAVKFAIVMIRIRKMERRELEGEFFGNHTVI